MKWLSRLKKSSIDAEMNATEPTKPIQRDEAVGFVGFVAPILAPIQKFDGNPAPANDPTPTPIKVQALPLVDSAGGEVINIGTIRPSGLSPALLAASLALDAQIHAAGTLTGGPDRHCWPNSTAMNSAEIDTFTARLARFTDKGVSHSDAERLADKLVMRDREQDDRRLCLECTHLGGYGTSSWRCDNWQRAGVAIRARDAQLPVDLVQQLQRCDGLTNAFNPTHTARTHP